MYARWLPLATGALLAGLFAGMVTAPSQPVIPAEQPARLPQVLQIQPQTTHSGTSSAAPTAKPESKKSHSSKPENQGSKPENQGKGKGKDQGRGNDGREESSKRQE